MALLLAPVKSSFRVPALMIVVLLYVLAPVRTSVPVPSLVRLATGVLLVITLPMVALYA